MASSIRSVKPSAAPKHGPGEPDRPDGAGRPTAWLILIYRVPSEPTRLRAAVWRRLKSLGAVYLQNSAAAMPMTSQSERVMRALRNDIVESMDGAAFLVTTSSILGEADLTAIFNAARDDEYEEILDKCRDFQAEIDKEIAASHFTYGELEENEEDLAKLRGWHEKVQARDLLGAAKAQDVVTALAQCVTRLDDFAHRVYEVDNARL